MTKDEAVHRWVSEFNEIDLGMIADLMEFQPEDWCEVTLPVVGDDVYTDEDSGTVISFNDDRYYTIEFQNGNVEELYIGDFNVNCDSYLPLWRMMWRFKDFSDIYWFEKLGGLRAMSDLGFRIYESQKYGYFFGIDGAGFDFYHQYWNPLYDARGLRWHNED